MLHTSEIRPRARRRDQNLRRILDKALELVLADGLESLSIQKLAAAVDYTPGALYRYFDSKAAILAQLVLRVLEDLRTYLDGALAVLPPAAPALARVLVLVRAYRAFARREPRRFGLLSITLADPRVLLAQAADADPVALEMVAGLQALANALDGAAEEGALSPGDATERTLCLFALLQGVSLFQKQARYAPDALDVERLALAGSRSLLVGWGADAAALAATDQFLSGANKLGAYLEGGK